MDNMKLMVALPAYLEIEGVNFELQLINNGGSEIRLVYDITHVDADSPHKQEYQNYGGWCNPLNNDSFQGFLYLAEGIETDNDLTESLLDCGNWLIKHNLWKGQA